MSHAYLPLGLSRSEPGSLPTPTGRKAPSTRERSPRPTSTAPLGPHSPPCWPGPSTYVTAEGNGSSDEGPINKDWKSVRVKASRQPAAIFAIEDQSGFPPEPGEGPVLETAGGEGARSARTTGVCGLARPRLWLGRGLALPVSYSRNLGAAPHPGVPTACTPCPVPGPPFPRRHSQF